MLSALERKAIEAFRETRTALRPDREDDAWTIFGLTMALQAGRLLRAESFAASDGPADRKSDGSPVTDVERKVEAMVFASLQAHGLEATTLGEESGGVLPDSGMAVAVDPVDGTWAYLSDSGTSATTIAVFRDGRPFLGVVASHARAEIGYALDGGAARLIRLSCYGEPDTAVELPYARLEATPILVNVHPARGASPVIDSLFSAWEAGRVSMVRSPGGSPAWALLEAAKGRFTYLNLWSDSPSAPWDLAAGALLVRAAGGIVAGLDGVPIDAVRHAGPFVAGIDAESIRIVSSIVALGV